MRDTALNDPAALLQAQWLNGCLPALDIYWTLPSFLSRIIYAYTGPQKYNQLPTLYRSMWFVHVLRRLSSILHYFYLSCLLVFFVCATVRYSLF